MEREIYLDNSATTKCYDSVRDIVGRVMTEDYGNPSSLHRKGMEAEKYIRDAKDIIARSLKAAPKEIYFTSGGTEADNMALIGAAMAGQRKGKHLITTGVEHPAVLNTMAYLEEQGFCVTYLPVDDRGRADLNALKEALSDETILVSMMYVNNEIGAVQPVEEAARMVKERCPGALFHVDAVQGFGKYRIYPKKLGIDLLSVSGHKIHGPKGVGILYVSDKVRICPILFGGGQQRDLRPGTENVPGIAGIGQAVKDIYTGFEEKTEQMYKLKERLTEGLRKLPDVSVNGPECREGAPHIVSAGFEGVRSEVLLHALEDRGIYVSSGSACASNHPAVSGTLKAIGIKKELLESTLRFSMSEFTTEEEIDSCLAALHELLPVLRRFVRK